MRRIAATLTVLVLTAAAAAGMASSASASFGIQDFGFSLANEDGSGAALAGSHPYAATTVFHLNTTLNNESKEVPDGEVRTFTAQLPTGVVGDTTTVPRCSNADFLDVRGAISIPDCPDDTAVGIIGVDIESKGPTFVWKPLFNLEPSKGEVARFGFSVLNITATIDVRVNENPPYNVTAAAVNIPQTSPVFSAKVEVWGNPADPVHNPLRGECMKQVNFPSISAKDPSELVPSGNCATDAPDLPFLTDPRACVGPVPFSVSAVAWLSGAVDAPAPSATPPFTGCADLGFGPTIGTEGTNSSSGSPSGLDFDLRVEDPGLTSKGGRADLDIEKTVVTLPEGFTTNPSVAAGLSACTLAEYREEGVNFNPNVGCPESADIGSVEVTSPLIDEKLSGQIYVAKQQENPFNSLIALYLVIRNEERGILVKQPLRVEPDSVTGRLTTTVSEIPQLPFSDFHLHFRDGPRAPLITPDMCGKYQVEARLSPYAQEVPAVDRSASLTVSTGANGRHCASSASQLPFAPSFSAGTQASVAGGYSPFVLRLSRSDGSQQFSSVSTTLPAGLLGRIAGIPYCPESGLAQAASRTGEGQGALELASPSCPSASEVGTVSVASGAGPEPLYVSGRAYLAGPYKGAPLSLEIVTPAIAGPFDLGVVAVRTALQVDPLTAQITAESDPIPTILHGLPLDVRAISVDTDRPGFTLNPTSCEPKAITGSATSTLGSVAPLSQYFQASNCAALAFKPKLKLSLKGSTRRAGHPALKAVLTYPKGSGYANVGRAQVNLPHSEFIDQGNLDKTCTRPVLLAGDCPKSAIYGKAKAWTPLLEKPLEGPVYLVGGFGYKLPALVAELNGQIRVLLVGKVDSGKNHGIRNTFETVPDAPVERFELRLKGGKKYSLLENSENLCKKPQKAIARFTAQNGKVLQAKPRIANGCKSTPRPKSRAKKSGRVHGRHRGR